MNSNKKKIWMGIWLIVIPFLGVPVSWKFWLVGITGIGLILHAVIMPWLRGRKIFKTQVVSETQAN